MRAFLVIWMLAMPPVAAADTARPRAPQVDSLSLCAKTVWAESRSEPSLGQLAVAFVIVNRTRQPDRFGATVAEVVQQSRQFSVWRQGSASRRRMVSLTDADPTYVQAKRLCLAALSGAVADPSNGALYFYSRHPPRWARSKIVVARISKHVFLKDRS